MLTPRGLIKRESKTLLNRLRALQRKTPLSPNSTSMKKKSASKSAFFNLRVLIGLCIALAGIGLALAALDAFAANSAPVKIRNHIITASNDPLVPVGFDCSKIEELGIHKQENFRAGAIMIACAADSTPGYSSVGALLSTRRPGCQKIARALVWRRGCQPDHRHGDLSEHYPVRDIHHG